MHRTLSVGFLKHLLVNVQASVVVKLWVIRTLPDACLRCSILAYLPYVIKVRIGGIPIQLGTSLFWCCEALVDSIDDHWISSFLSCQPCLR